MKRIFLNSKISLKRRLKLFDSTVSACVLWCTQSWTPKVDDIRKLGVAQHSMLRRMLGPNRSPAETWVEWIKRSTNKVMSIAESCGVRVWPLAHAVAKWNWAGHVSRRPASSWLMSVSSWMDSDWQASALERGGVRPLRPSKRRWVKWEDSLRRFCACYGHRSWTDLAQNRELWSQYNEAFGQWYTEP